MLHPKACATHRAPSWHTGMVESHDTSIVHFHIVTKSAMQEDVWREEIGHIHTILIKHPALFLLAVVLTEAIPASYL